MVLVGRGLVAACVASVATAQMDHGNMDMGSGGMTGGDATARSTHDDGTQMAMGCGDLSCGTSTAFMHENMAMHEDMAIEFTCDVEVDFVRGMIPHHAGAIKMCAILRDEFSGGMTGRRRAQMDMGGGLDPFLDGLCTAIEAGQATEITAMEAWLAAKGLANTTSCEGSATPLEMMGMAMGCGNSSCATTMAFMHENMAMHGAMAIEFTCDVEVDFVRGMIPHHAGAITMCAILRDEFSGGMNSTGGMDHGSGGMDMGGRRRAQMDNSGTGSSMTGESADMMDPFLDGLCTAIEAGQATEVAEMENWLTNNGHALAAPCAAGSMGESPRSLCNFGALLAAVQAAMANGDLAGLTANPIFADCQTVAAEIAATESCSP